MGEATVICLDNSEWSRNGDFPPSRLMAQQDAACLLLSSILEKNYTSTVGILAMAGSRVEVKSGLTSDIGILLTSLHSTESKGRVDLGTSLKISSLILKNRANKSQTSRIVVFVCSPFQKSGVDFNEIARNLRRNNISLQIICFGEPRSKDTLEELVLNAGESAQFVLVPRSVGMLFDYVPVGNTNSHEEVDHELEQAMRLSLEEAKRQQEEAKLEVPEEDEEELLRMAMEISLELEDPTGNLQEDNQEIKEVFIDKEFVSSLLENLKGVDMQDPAIQSALQSMAQAEEKTKKDDKN